MTDKPTGSNVSASASSSASVSTSSGGARTARVETRTIVPVEYKVVDLPWQPSDPAITGTMLTDAGQQGWQLIIAYPDQARERTRWIFSR